MIFTDEGEDPKCLMCGMKLTLEKFSGMHSMSIDRGDSGKFMDEQDQVGVS
jgi:hypothetical protein